METKAASKVITYVVFGVGGTGSNLVPFLAQTAQKESRIYLVDGDVVEEKNMRNQKYISRDLGKHKADVLQARFKKVYPKLQMKSIPRYVSEDDLESFVQILDKNNHFIVLIGCVDNGSARAFIHKLFYDKRLENVMYVDSGNGDERRTGQVITALKVDGDVKSPTCADLCPDILKAKDGVQHEVSCEVRAAQKPQNIGTNVMAATLLLNIINNAVNFGYMETNLTLFNCENMTVVARKAGMKEESK